MKFHTANPFELIPIFWPEMRLYDKQMDIINSVWNDDETVVPAANMMGKDFVASVIAVLYFLTRYPCRIVTTSVRDDHLDILWGEMNARIKESRVALRKEDGGPLIVNHHEIRRWEHQYEREAPLCYIKGIVTKQGEGLSGHHIAQTGDGIPRTLAIADEASGVDDEVHQKVTAWANRFLTIGNCWPCNNWFRYSIEGRPGTTDKGGDIPRDDNSGFYRRIIPITAYDSPNVKFAQEEIRRGRTPSGRVIIPGVKSWQELQKSERLWDEERKTVGLKAQFYKGAALYLYPEEWLDLAEEFADIADQRSRRVAKGIGVDCAEGGDSTALVAVDEEGVIDVVSEKTPDTSKIPNMVIKFMRQHRCAMENVLFDRGGGGYQHVMVLRAKGFKVRSISFGEQADMESEEKWKYFHSRKQRKFEAEEKTLYKNRRAQLYGTVRELLQPIYETGFGIPRRFVELRQQMAPIPLWWEDGKLVIPPKDKKPDAKEDDKVTLKKLLGRSPDELDALTLAVHAMCRKVKPVVLGSLVGAAS